MDAWERSPFAMGATQLDLHDAIVAIQRLLQRSEVLGDEARALLERTERTLREVQA